MIKRRPLVMICDDDCDDHLLVREAFRDARAESMLAFVCSGEELMAFLEKSCSKDGLSESPCPDLILLDLNMSPMSGLVTLKRIKAHPLYRSIPVVVFTTSRDAADIRQSYDAGANSFISKPADHEEFMEMVRQLERYWFHTAQLPRRRCLQAGGDRGGYFLCEERVES